MKQQGIQDDSWTETSAMRLVHRLDAAESRPGRRAFLERTVQDEVIPRLLSTRFAVREDTAQPLALQHGHVFRLVAAALHGRQATTDDLLAALRRAGLGMESLLLDLIAPAARRMGEMWEDDTCSFSDVTLGTLHLCRAMRSLDAAAAEQEPPLPAGAPRVLLAQAPGEQHSLGLSILARFFRQAGWDVTQKTPRSSAELASLTARQAYDLVGLSVFCDDRLDHLAAEIARIRHASRNPGVLVMVGGPPFTARPALADNVGADATASDGHLAVRCAHQLLSRQACPA